MLLVRSGGACLMLVIVLIMCLASLAAANYEDTNTQAMVNDHALLA